MQQREDEDAVRRREAVGRGPRGRSQAGLSQDRWVCLDVGETIIDETRIWSAWADELAVPPLTLHAALGAVIARGDAHPDVFSMFGADDWRDRVPAVEREYGGFRGDDLYPDALAALAALRAQGYRLAVIGNQPTTRTAELKAIGVEADVIAMSDELGLAKPDPAFFARGLELMDGAEPGSVAYVGDRIDNDVVPAIAAGMRAVWLRRGPWGVIQELPEDVRPSLVVDSLAELTERIAEAWPAA